MTYNIYLEDQLIGTTLLEKGDAPMGVVMGKIDFIIENIGYDFFKEYCIDNNIVIYNDDPEDKILTTAGIPKLIVKDENGIDIKGVATYIEGMDGEGFDVTIQGIPYPFYEEEFPHHVAAYNNQLK